MQHIIYNRSKIKGVLLCFFANLNLEQFFFRKDIKYQQPSEQKKKEGNYSVFRVLINYKQCVYLLRWVAYDRTKSISINIISYSCQVAQAKNSGIAIVLLYIFTIVINYSLRDLFSFIQTKKHLTCSLFLVFTLLKYIFYNSF